MKKQFSIRKFISGLAAACNQVCALISQPIFSSKNRIGAYFNKIVFANIPIQIAIKLKKYPFCYRFARKGYCFFFPPIRAKIERALTGLTEVNFLKIGANDGLENDPLGDLILTDLRFRGVLVEPIPYISRKLAGNYRDGSRFKIEQAAITKFSGMARMYCVAENATDSKGQSLASWISGIGSFDREHLSKHLSAELQGTIQAVDVPCFTFKELLARNQLPRLDLVHVDTEGHDFMIIQQIDFNRWRPKIVLFEHKHLQQSEKEEARRFVINKGYQVWAYDSDFLCVDNVK